LSSNDPGAKAKAMDRNPYRRSGHPVALAASAGTRRRGRPPYGPVVSALIFLALITLGFGACAAGSSGAVTAPMPAQDKVVRQQWDFSCGAAALATILTYQQNDAVSETEVVDGLMRHTTVERVRLRGGFSLLELKRYAEARGYGADGFGNLSLEDLSSLAPAIVPLRLAYGNHFVVFRGAEGHRVLLADPDEGTKVMELADFERLWVAREAFVVLPKKPGVLKDQLTASPSDFAAFDRRGHQTNVP
jgi:uncharacterized protein